MPTLCATEWNALCLLSGTNDCRGYRNGRTGCSKFQ